MCRDCLLVPFEHGGLAWRRGNPVYLVYPAARGALLRALDEALVGSRFITFVPTKRYA